MPFTAFSLKQVSQSRCPSSSSHMVMALPTSIQPLVAEKSTQFKCAVERPPPQNVFKGKAITSIAAGYLEIRVTMGKKSVIFMKNDIIGLSFGKAVPKGRWCNSR